MNFSLKMPLFFNVWYPENLPFVIRKQLQIQEFLQSSYHLQVILVGYLPSQSFTFAFRAGLTSMQNETAVATAVLLSLQPAALPPRDPGMSPQRLVSCSPLTVGDRAGLPGSSTFGRADFSMPGLPDCSSTASSRWLRLLWSPGSCTLSSQAHTPAYQDLQPESQFGLLVPGEEQN